MESVLFKLQAFEGPMELLCYLIDKNEIDIYDIPIAELTAQYIEYIRDFPYDMESISSFLVMASNLLEIKSKMLLPRPKIQDEEEEDPREELVRRLMEYKKFKELSDVLRKKHEEGKGVIFKDAEEELKSLTLIKNIDVRETLDGVTINMLFDIFSDILRRRELKEDKVRASFSSIKKDAFTVDEKIFRIRAMLSSQKRFAFDEVFDGSADKEEIIVTFLAVLELIKLKEVKISQKDVFDKIYISEYER